MRSRVASLLAVMLVVISGCGSGPSTELAPEELGELADPPLTLAVIGDAPYGDAQENDFPELVRTINSHVDVDVVVHLGDIKTGRSPCDDVRFNRVRRLLDSFEHPVVYTPGDNEWTDCEPFAPGDLPTDRLALLRRVFFPRPGRSIGGRPMRVTTQARGRGFERYVENVLWSREDVVFGTVHIVGSKNGRTPWFNGAETPAQRAVRQAEVDARVAADLAWIDRVFRRARRSRARGVMLAVHADMFAGRDATAFDKLVDRLAKQARAFKRPVLLLNGDTHRYMVDRPLSDAPNVKRVVVEGDTTTEWLRVNVDPSTEEVFSTARIRASQRMVP